MTDASDRIVRVCEVLEGRTLCVFLLIGSDGAVLVDTGLSATPQRTIEPALARRGLGWDDLLAVVVTHADVDHSGGLGAVRRLAPRARTIAGAVDKPLIESVDALLDCRYREFVRDHAVDQEPAFIAWVRSSADDGTIDETLASNARLRIDAVWSVELLAVPGHTAGHIAIHDPISATTIAADAVLGAGLPGSDGTPAFAPTYRYAAAYRATIERLRNLRPRRLLCSHLPELRDGAVDAYLAESVGFYDRLEHAVVDTLATSGPCTLAEMIDAVAPRVATWPPEANDTLAQPVVAHLEELCLRGDVTQLPGRPVRYASAP